MTRNQDYNRNPTGKGGFGDNPQNRSHGRWKKENSQSYCLNKFLSMKENEFVEWGEKNPPNERTVAQLLAYERVMQARKKLPDYREVVDRTEGQPQQDITLSNLHIYRPEQMKDGDLETTPRTTGIRPESS